MIYEKWRREGGSNHQFIRIDPRTKFNEKKIKINLFDIESAKHTTYRIQILNFNFLLFINCISWVCVLSQKFSVEYQNNKKNSSTFAPEECERCSELKYPLHDCTIPSDRVYSALETASRGVAPKLNESIYISPRKRKSQVERNVRPKWRPTMSWYYLMFIRTNCRNSVMNWEK